MREALRRADNILARCRWLERRPTGRHHRDVEPPPKRHRAAAVTATAAVLALGGGVGWVAVADESHHSLAAAVPTDCPAPNPQHEQTYLRELELAGVPLDPPGAADKATAIGRKHVAHCHLTGMRDDIEADFRRDLPHLTPQQVIDARVVMEHLFLDVTGRKQ